MFLLQSLTPPEHEVLLIDGNAQPMDEAGIAQYVVEQKIGLVGIGAMTRMVAKAYRMADAIRAVGVPVVMGGPHVTEEAATNYLNNQTRIQQQVIKERVEAMCDSAQAKNALYRGVIVGRYQAGSEDAIIQAFKKSDETELPHMLGVKSRHVWVLGDIYMHFVEAEASLPTVLKEYSSHPLFKEIKTELDKYVRPLSPDHYPGVAKEIYQWRKREGTSLIQQ